VLAVVFLFPVALALSDVLAVVVVGAIALLLLLALPLPLPLPLKLPLVLFPILFGPSHYLSVQRWMYMYSTDFLPKFSSSKWMQIVGISSFECFYAVRAML
jgi:hypothetical protein